MRPCGAGPWPHILVSVTVVFVTCKMALDQNTVRIYNLGILELSSQLHAPLAFTLTVKISLCPLEVSGQDQQMSTG
jgi:hypothetical protein